MGDRGNIVVKQHNPNGSTEHIYMYTHNRGSDLLLTTQKALAESRSRWDDEQYFTRIVFHTLLDGDREETGYGLTTYLCDNGHPLILLDCEERTVSVHAEDDVDFQRPMHKWQFEEFLKLGEPQLERAWQ